MIEIEDILDISEEFVFISVQKKHTNEWKKGQYFIIRYGDNLSGEVVFPVEIRGKVYFGICKDSEVYKYISDRKGFENIEGPCGKPLDMSRFKNPLGVSKGKGIFPILSVLEDIRIYNIGNSINMDLIRIRGLSDINILKKIIEEIGCDVILTAGDNELSEYISNMNLGCEVYACVETPILDGTGLCIICRVYINGEMKLNCVDGPWFPAKFVDWEGLRNKEVSKGCLKG